VAEFVERARDRRGRTEVALQHDDVPGRSHPATELGEHAVERFRGIAAANRMREHISRPSELVMRLLQSELANIPRDRRLRNAAA